MPDEGGRSVPQHDQCRCQRPPHLYHSPPRTRGLHQADRASLTWQLRPKFQAMHPRLRQCTHRSPIEWSRHLRAITIPSRSVVADDMSRSDGLNLPHKLIYNALQKVIGLFGRGRW
jgi:hypothetical protein